MRVFIELMSTPADPERSELGPVHSDLSSRLKKLHPLKQNENGRVAADRHLPLFAHGFTVEGSSWEFTVFKCIKVYEHER